MTATGMPTPRPTLAPVLNPPPPGDGLGAAEVVFVDGAVRVFELVAFEVAAEDLLLVGVAELDVLASLLALPVILK